MKRRLMCLLLCLLTVLPVVLTACADADKSGTEGEEMNLSFTDDTVAMTIVLYSICNESTTDAAIARVQKELNTITESTYKTHIELRLYPEAEYYQVLDQKMKELEAETELKARLAEAANQARKAVKGAGVTTSPELKAEEILLDEDEEGESTESTSDYVEETKVNDSGFAETVYPEATPGQMDIFLITDYTRYKDYVEKELITNVSSDLSVGFKILNSYINPLLLEGVKFDGGVYGIPNNHVLGNYEFILLNRQLADKYYIDVDSIGSMGDLTDYLDLVIKYEKEYTPMVNYGSNLGYYIDNKPSMVGAYISSDMFEYNGTQQFVSAISPRLLFAFRQYQNYYITRYQYRDYITYADSIDGMDNVACAVLTGNIDIRDRYEEDYYVLTYKNPILYQDEIFSSVYAISTYAQNSTRCMEILQLLTTNEQFCNIFRYGVKDVDYTVDSKTGVVHPLDSGYSMNPLYTGNMFKLWQSDAMSESELLLSENNWGLAKNQNGEAALDPYYGFVWEENPDVIKAEDAGLKYEDTVPEEEQYTPVRDSIAKFDELYQDFLERYEAFEPYTEDGMEVDIELFIKLITSEYASYPEVKDAFKRDYEYSLTNQVEKWYKEKYNIGD